jgi:glyoxylase-like metal-dependent hydrolase (beta-lactamase superfamily II)
MPSWISAIQRVLKEENASITQALITHWHHDHTGGQGDLLKVSPSTKFYKNTPDEGQLDIADGQTFQVEGASLRAVFSPGHTQDHMALVLEEEDAMFTGDNVLGHGTAVFEDLDTYLQSLDRMQREFSGRAYPGHGAVVEDGPAKVAEYVRHRKQREDQVLAVLRSSNPARAASASGDQATEWSSMEIVKVVYKDVAESLHLPAERGVLQILYKLEKEDRVEEIGEGEGETWRIKSRAAL